MKNMHNNKCMYRSILCMYIYMHISLCIRFCTIYETPDLELIPVHIRIGDILQNFKVCGFFMGLTLSVELGPN